MSTESYTWLNQNTLIGFADERGRAWHYKASEQGTEPNHYPGSIPVEDVRRRLFPWEAVEGQITATHLSEDGVLSTVDPERKAIMRGDTGDILGIFKTGYQIHQYEEWLIETVQNLLDDDELGIASAGLLQNGGVAWVTIEVPDSIKTPEGVEFRPFVSAATSHNGTLSSTFKRGASLPVCDNTLAAALVGGEGRLKVRHSRYSNLKLEEARNTLGLIYDTADQFSEQVKQLCDTPVSEKQWRKFNDLLLPVPEKKGRSQTIAVNKRAALTNLWENDNRVSPWRNTAFGVVQAVNTADHHIWSAPKTRVERNQFKSLTGGFDKLDADTLDTLNKVLATA